MCLAEFESESYSDSLVTVSLLVILFLILLCLVTHPCLDLPSFSLSCCFSCSLALLLSLPLAEVRPSISSTHATPPHLVVDLPYPR